MIIIIIGLCLFYFYDIHIRAAYLRRLSANHSLLPHATIPAITAKKTFTPIKEVSPLAEVSPIKCCQKELKSLEANRLIERNVYDTFARTVEYSITAHGLSLDKVLNELHYWGLAHRKKIIGLLIFRRPFLLAL